MSKIVRGRFVWHELLTSDPKAAVGFYEKVVGWKARVWEKDPSYTLLMMKDSLMAGAMALPAEAKAMNAPPNWLSYISTPDVDATAKQAAGLGGKTLKEPMDLPEIGRFAVLQDPQGAVFAAFTPLEARPNDSRPGLGDFSWHELLTSDWPRAFEFYQRLFGWEKTEAMEMGPGSTYQMFGWKGNTLGGMFNKPVALPGPPFWLPYAVVADSKVVAERVKKLGGTIMNGPMQVPGGEWIVQGLDLQGAMFAVHSRAQTAAAPPAPGRPTAKAKPPRAAQSAKSAKPAKSSKPAKSAKAPAKKVKPARPAKASKKRGAASRAGARKKAQKPAARKKVKASARKRR